MSKYKAGDRFIVEIDDVILGSDKECNNSTMYRIKGFNTLIFDRYGLDKLQQVNPQLKIEDIDDMLAEHDLKMKSYNQGLQDAWELARKIFGSVDKGGYSDEQLEEAFGCSYLTMTQILYDLTPQEALAKLEAYEQEKAELKRGDMVEFLDDGSTGMYLGQGCDGKHWILFSDNEVPQKAKTTEIRKTGKHIEIQQILDSIGTN